jgi:hypothetical protein
MSDQINGQIRAILSGLGATLTAFGFSDASVLTGSIGAVIYGVAAVWSWVSKQKKGSKYGTLTK